ncbi:hypothetical protein TPHA_0G03590 [Tetrapisispora phaffii CBS 4417]|uniref:Uncharacterized protein n=1 Tax=Tetrapisispora phaffii (strain ATCC 24235 / CBS 4417 / NBRC 1672 / NRRL Y-8282 / UCD 70-5) TaxID=1071381 RepID=G8BWC1_TETPH|nr:hypothetical protein TPHA_0G03590 [Tetrapisispora phaffii CBS 4417]CCE64199.1 hypothetical protein TPHA_0G03590 [Tetrapisispora phaffii CBS 4417]
MDGLLLNTEDIYTTSTNITLKQHGKKPMTWDLKIQLQGLPGPQASARVIEHYDLPLTPEEYMKESAELQKDLWATCAFLPGALELLKYLKSKNIPIALCTSSNKAKFVGKTSHLKDAFALFDAIVTGDDPRIPEGRGKPFPDIWHTGLSDLNNKFGTSILPEECMVFEDGIIGVKAGIAFGGHVIWVPHPEAIEFLPEPITILEDKGEMLTSLANIDLTKYSL